MNDKKIRELVSLRELNERYPFFKRSFLKNLIYERHKNGLAPAIYKISSRTLKIDVEAFENWLKQKQGE